MARPLPPDWAPPSGDRRRARRRPCHVVAICRSADTELAGIATEISPLGMYVETGPWTSRSDSIEVLLGHYLLPTPVLLRARVAYQKPSRAHRVGLGLEFTGLLPDDAERFLRRYGHHFDRPRVLMVDDEPELLRLLDNWMERAGYKLLGVESPFETIEGILRFRPHALIVSCDMPGLSGPELCRLVRATPSLGDVPVVLMSMGDPNDMTTVAEACGASAWLHRHARTAALVRTIERLVRPQPVLDEGPGSA